MKKKKRLTILLPACLALALAAGAATGEALAYFTTYASASGRVQVSLDFTRTETGDEVRDWTKHIFIQNTGEQECFVRVKVLAGEKYQKYLSFSAEREGSWELKEDGFWYYDAVLTPGEKTTELLAGLNRELLKQDTENGSQEEFNVIVVQEYTPVLYDGEGNPYADWTMKVRGSQAERDGNENTGNENVGNESTRNGNTGNEEGGNENNGNGGAGEEAAQ